LSQRFWTGRIQYWEQAPGGVSMRVTRLGIRAGLVIAAVGLLAAACGGPTGQASPSSAPAASPVAGSSAPPPTSPTVPERAAVATQSVDGQAVPAAASDLPALFSEELRDVVAGETFQLAGFLGKVVVMESMAVWCPLCTTQQGHVKRAKARLDDQVVFLSVDVDPNENEEILSRYAERRAWDWSFVAPGAGFARDLSSLTSPFVLDPTATPIIIIDRQGGIHQLRRGIKSADELVE